MDAQHSKKLLQHDILEILKLHTDKEHPMSQNKILERLKDNYCLLKKSLFSGGEKIRIRKR